MPEIRISIDRLGRFIVDLTRKIGLEKIDADILTESLIDADLKGIRSHGVLRLPIYIKRMESGVIDIAKKVEVVKEKGSIILRCEPWSRAGGRRKGHGDGRKQCNTIWGRNLCNI